MNENLQGTTGRGRPSTLVDALPPRLVAQARLLRLEIVKREDISLAEAVAPFLRWLANVRGYPENTIRSYGSNLKTFVRFCAALGLTRPRDVVREEIELYMDYVRQQGARATTVNHHLDTLRTFWKYLKRERVVTDKPTEDIYRIREPRRLPRRLTDTEREEALAALSRDRSLLARRDYAMILTLADTGIRPSEVATLRLDQLHVNEAILRVIGKRDKEREAPLSPRLRDTLRTYLAEVRPRFLQPRRRELLAYVAAHAPVTHRAVARTLGATQATELAHLARRGLLQRPRPPQASVDPERLYELSAAAPLVSMTYYGLRHFLQRHRNEFPARYRVIQQAPPRRLRLLSGSEINRIRARRSISGTYTLTPKGALLLAHGRSSPYVFVGYPTGGSAHHPLSTRKGVWQIVHDRLSPLVGRPVHPYMLRHSFATRLLERGANLALIQEAMGHDDISTTIRHYAHLSTSRRNAELARLLAEE